MEIRNERRRVDRSRIRQHLLKRVAVLALSTAAALLVVPLVLVELGVLGPTPAERVSVAERAVAVAQAYGARPDDPPLRAAEQELVEARRLVSERRVREARAAAARAVEQAVEAQRAALTRRDESRRRAQEAIDDLDRRVNGLEELYGQVTPGLPKAEVSRLFSRMKRARETAGLLFLAFEEGRHDQTIAGADAARQVLTETEQELLTVKK
jgi:hypothetical protein